MTELCEETNSGTATISRTPRSMRRSTADWIVARVAIPSATSVGTRASTLALKSLTVAFQVALPPCAISTMPRSLV